MTGAALPLPIAAASRPRIAPAVRAALVLLVAALLLRGGRIGDPLAGFDEQFYLLVGDRIWHGAVPYVDLWDRKPAGLFLLFAAIRALPGDGVAAAQAVATLFAAATAWCVALLARRAPAVGWAPATLAGIVYLGGVDQLWGSVAQTPVFYNLPIAAAALLTLRAAGNPRDRGAAVMAMLLAGTAIQIKTNAAFEAVFFGLWLTAATWRATRSAPATLRRAAILALIGGLPTLLVIGWYISVGAFDAWWQANVLSVVAKGRPNDAIAVATLVESASLFAPFALLAVAGLHLRRRSLRAWDGTAIFQACWVAVAATDFVALGGYWPHYALPLLLACAPLVSSVLALRIWGPALCLFAVAPSAWQAVRAPVKAARNRALAAQVTAALPADVRTRCLFLFEGPPIYYHLTQACLVSPFAYPAHLSTVREAAAIPGDAATELRRAMARRPGTVISVRDAPYVGRDAAQEAILLAELRRAYRPIAMMPYAPRPASARLVIWRRNDLAAR